MSETREISECRVCGNTQLSPILSLGNMYVSNFVDSADEEKTSAPLELVLCSGENACSLLQLKHTIPSHALYRNYWYRSGMNQSMMNALADIAQKAERMIDLKAKDIVLDIGCNDGTLLRSYSNKNSRTVGFEPAENLISYAEKGTTKIINDFFNAAAFEKEFPAEKARVITTIAMFYDLDDPNQFVADVKKCLHEEGVWVIQMMDLVSMIEKNAFDNICHEHLEYYSLYSLEKLLARHSLKVFDLEMNEVNGGSLRVYVKNQGSSVAGFEGAEGRVNDLRDKERRMKLDVKEPHQAFADHVNAEKNKLVSFIKQEVGKGKSVYVYGASTKGNTLLQFYGLDEKLITAAAERNPDKWGKRTVGSNIPIISEEQARAQKPDYFLVLPWHFMKEFVQREKAFFEQGGKFIAPLPEFTVFGLDE
jgi:NDP-4-keto-2,6-dideoxyhexose 3-C-methyltransferase